MTVDLHRPTEAKYEDGAIVTFRNGMTFFSWVVGQDEDGDYEVRLEDGWYLGYLRDGRRCPRVEEVNGKKRWVRNPNAGEDPWDVVGLEWSTIEASRARGITNNWREAYRKTGVYQDAGAIVGLL